MIYTRERILDLPNYDKGLVEGDFNITIVRGRGVNFKIIKEIEEKNQIELEAKRHVTNGLIGQVNSYNGPTKVRVVGQALDGSGNDQLVSIGATTTSSDGTGEADNKVTWDTSTAGGTTSGWAVMGAQVDATGEVINFKLEDDNGNEFATNSHDPDNTIYANDLFRVQWSIKVTGYLVAGNTAGAAGLKGIVDQAADGLWQSDNQTLVYSAGGTTVSANKGDGGTKNHDASPSGYSDITSTWPNSNGDQWDGNASNSPAGTHTNAIIALGNTALASKTSWSGPEYSGDPPNNGSRVSAKFQVRA